MLGLLTMSASALRAQSPAAREMSPPVAAALWGAGQLVPSPVLITGSTRVGGGLRWQLTLLLFAYGLVERPVRSLIVNPIARHAGAVELYASPAWLCCAPRGHHSWLLNLGSRVYTPITGRGESWSASFGASYYLASPRHGAALEVGVYAVSSIVGLTISVAPWLTGREVSTTLSFHLY